MGKTGENNLVTESADMLFKMAEMDVMSVDILITHAKYSADQMCSIICFHVTMAVEKYLKGFILNNEKNVEKIHNLDKLHKSASDIDPSFLSSIHLGMLTVLLTDTIC